MRVSQMLRSICTSNFQAVNLEGDDVSVRAQKLSRSLIGVFMSRSLCDFRYRIETVRSESRQSKHTIYFFVTCKRVFLAAVQTVKHGDVSGRDQLFVSVRADVIRSMFM